MLNLFRKSKDGKDRRSLGSSSNPSSPVGTLTRQTSIPMISIGGKEVYFTERSRSFRKPKNKGTDSAENTPPSSRHNSYSKASAASNRELPPSGSRHSSASKSPAIPRKDLPPSGGRYTKSPAANRRDLVNAMSPPLPKRERSSSYVNVAHSRSGSDISSNAGSNSIIHHRSGSDIGSSSTGSRQSSEMRHMSSSSSKAETVCWLLPIQISTKCDWFINFFYCCILDCSITLLSKASENYDQNVSFTGITVYTYVKAL